MIIYDFEFTQTELILLSALVVFFSYQLYFYLHYLRGVLRLKKQISKNKVNFDTQKLPVSVIICAKDELENLRKYLPFVLNQDYPEYEVIVVNDGSGEDTDILLNNLMKDYPHLRTTFVPSGATNLSTKKLALTLGVKAAKYDWLLFTDADCMPEDKTWIARMARNFNPGIEFVLGYGAYFQQKGLLSLFIGYDTLYSALQYMGFAIAHKPYMGVGRNMAYSKAVFYRQKGFASTLHLRSGDDDLMVNHAANGFNTRVEVAHDSVTWSEPKKRFRDWYYQKERHLSVSTFYTSSSKFRLAIEPFFKALFYVAFILTLVFGNIITQGVALLLFIVRLIVQYSVINSSAKHFGQRRFVFTLPLFDILLPLVQLFIMTFGRMGSKAKNIHWK
jgi:cellulose synthase/poly-beta-1,6-N-acetylglucosamine synthase-like glycosyltransferase